MAVTRRSILLFFCLFSGTVQSASAGMFGMADNFNLFTIGDATLNVVENSDAQGSVAIGGDATLTNYAVASKRSGSDALLVVDGHLSYTNGQVGENGSGSIYAQSATLTGTTPTAYYTAGSGVDFSAAATYLKTASATWGNLAATGTTVVQSWGGIDLSGTNSDLNIFAVDGASLFGASSLNISAPTGSTVLVNISGNVTEMKNMGIALSGIKNSNILYNFYDATTLTFEGISIQGSVLAPLASVDFDNGHINGQMIAYTLGSQSDASSGEFHDIAFTGQLAAVPVPGTFWLLGSALCALSIGRKKRD